MMDFIRCIRNRFSTIDYKEQSHVLHNGIIQHYKKLRKIFVVKICFNTSKILKNLLGGGLFQ